MVHTEWQRKVLALLLAVMVIALTVFISTLGQGITSHHNTLTAIEEHAQQQIEEYLALALRINQGFLDSIAGDWHAYQAVVPEVDFADFSDRFVAPLISSAHFSVIITCCGRRYYTQPEYAALTVDIETLSACGKTHVLYGSPDRPFGTAERFYVAGRVLTDGERHFQVYVGFLEQVMFGNFINALDLDLLGDARNGLEHTLRATQILLVLVIVFGFTLLYHAHKLRVVVYRDIVEEMGGAVIDGRIYGRRKTDKEGAENEKETDHD